MHDGIAVPSLCTYLRSPRDHLRRLEADPKCVTSRPLRAWSWLAGIAIVGSAVYGASLSIVLPVWRARSAGLWLTLSAGLSWCFFGPVLVVATQLRPRTCIHACLVTMAYGEAVLTIGAVLNLVSRLAGTVQRFDPVRFNLAWVGLSNVVMAATLASQLRAVRVPLQKSLLVWLVVLDGSGAICFWLFRRLLGMETR